MIAPAVIDGVRLERWINTAWEERPSEFRLLGVLVPNRLMKGNPLSTEILSEIERRVNVHEALLEAAKNFIRAYRQGIIGDEELNLDEAIVQADRS